MLGVFGFIFILGMILILISVVMILFGFMVNVAYVIIAICLFTYGVTYLMYEHGKKLTDYNSLIPNKEFQQAAMFTPFNPNKPIIFVPEQFIGVCIGNDIIPTKIDKDEKTNIIYMLSKSYNVFLKLSNLNIGHKDIRMYCKYIFDNKYPICFIANKFPPLDLLTDISFNNGKYWLTVFDQRKYDTMHKEK